MIYNIYVAESWNTTLFLFAVCSNLTSYSRIQQAQFAIDAKASTLASATRAADWAFNFGSNNEKSRRFWRPTSRRLFTKGLTAMYASMRDILTFLVSPVKTLSQSFIPNIPTLESHPDGAYPVGDSPVAYEVDLTLTRGGAFPPIPRSFLSLSSQSPVNPSGPVVSLMPGAGGLSGGAA